MSRCKAWDQRLEFPPVQTEQAQETSWTFINESCYLSCLITLLYTRAKPETRDYTLRGFSLVQQRAICITLYPEKICRNIMANLIERNLYTWFISFYRRKTKKDCLECSRETDGELGYTGRWGNVFMQKRFQY